MRVLDVVKAAAGQIFVHKVEVTTGFIRTGDPLKLLVDDAFRRRTRANHTATHLLQVRCMMPFDAHGCRAEWTTL